MTGPTLSLSPTSPAAGSAQTTAHATDPYLTSAERDQLIQALKDSEAKFVTAVSTLSDAQWKWKPAPERWSVGECAEHIMLAESQLFAQAQKAIKNSPATDWETATQGKTELLLRVMAPRLGQAHAPEMVVPGGGIEKAVIMQRFAQVRSVTLKFTEETQLPLKRHLGPHPFPDFNPLNAYQWVLFIPLHHMRHNKQIEEVKMTAGFPMR